MKRPGAISKRSRESQTGAEGLPSKNRQFFSMAIPLWLDPLPAILIACAMSWWTWNKWPDIVIDFGRELYIAWQLSLGKILYLDIAYFNGPLSPYFNSLWFRFFGPHLIVLVLVNLALLCLLIIFICLLVRKISGRPGAVAASLVFVSIFAFGDYTIVGNYNYVCPYSHEMVHGVLLSFGALLCLTVYCDTMRMSALCAAGVLTGLVFLTKAEIFMSLFCAMAVALIVTLALKRTRIPASMKIILGFLASAVFPPLIAVLSMIPVLGPSGALRGAAGSFYYLLTDNNVARLPFYQSGMGTDDIVGNLARMLISAVLMAGFLEIAAGFGILLGRTRLRHPAIPAIVLVLGTLVFGLVFRTYWLIFIGRPFPLILLIIGAALCVFVIRLFQRVHFDKRTVQQLALVVFALVLLGKMLLCCRIYQYGFVLAMPAAMVVTVLIVDWLPAWVSLRGGFGRVTQAAGIALLLIVSGQFILLSSTQIAAKTLRVSNGSDTILAYPWGYVVNQGLSALRNLLKPGETMAVLPEGVMLNYLVRVENPTPYVNFMPPEVLMFGEEEMIAAFKAHPPDYIVALPRPVSEYGFEEFGKDYASNLVSWVGDNYQEIVTICPEETREVLFGKLTILHRKQP